MTGTFRCTPTPCPQCAMPAMDIQRTDASTWAGKIAALPDDSRECVREYLRGIYQRGRVCDAK